MVAGALAAVLGVVASAGGAQTLDNMGTEFIFGFIPAKDDEGPVSLSLEILSDADAEVTVEYPVGEIVGSTKVTPTTPRVVGIPVGAHAGWGSGSTVANAVRVSATAEVSVVMLEEGYGSDDRALALPVDALGIEYVIMSTNPQQTLGSEFVVVAAQDDTLVWLNGQGPVKLQRGQGFLRNGKTSLAGTIVTATRPIAVTNGNKCAEIPALSQFCEHMLEFAIPVPHWGMEVLARNTPNNFVGDGVRRTVYRVAASENGTVVSLDGKAVATLARGGIYEVTRQPHEVAARFTADHPILVVQYTNGLCDEFPESVACFGGYPASSEYGDPSMVTLLATNQYVRKSRFIGAGWVNLVARTDDVVTELVQLDGAPIPTGSFTQYTTARGFSHAQVLISGAGIHTIESRGEHSATAVRLQAFTALTWPAAMQFEPVVPPICGDGVADLGEQCDAGADNGQPFSCCSADCTLRSVGAICRSSAGPCDVTEACTGIGPACPGDVKSTALCRMAAGPCDLAERCDGVRDGCPADEYLTAGTVCRTAAGPCDVKETCTGTGPSCPADAKAADGTPCEDRLFCNGADTCFAGSCSRHTGDPCPGPDGDADCAESCDEAAGDCTGRDAEFAPCEDGDRCTSNDRCAAGTCTGNSISCPGGEVCDPASGVCGPSNLPCAEGAPCDDGDACTWGDVCAGGQCRGLIIACDDGNPCTADRCDPQVGCRSDPVPDGQACGNDGDGCTKGNVCSNGVCGRARCDVEVRQVTDPQTGDPLPQIDVECALGKARGNGRCIAQAFVEDAALRSARAASLGDLRFGRMPTLSDGTVSTKVGGRIRRGRTTLRLSLTDRGRQILGELGVLRVRVVTRVKRGGKKMVVKRLLNLLHFRR